MSDDLVARLRDPDNIEATLLVEAADALEAKDARIAELSLAVSANLTRAQEADAERDAAMRRAEEAERDARRLDALASLAHGDIDVTIYPPGNHGGDPNGWLLSALDSRTGTSNEWEGDSLRAAIDAAIAQEQP